MCINEKCAQHQTLELNEWVHVLIDVYVLNLKFLLQNKIIWTILGEKNFYTTHDTLLWCCKLNLFLLLVYGYY